MATNLELDGVSLDDTSSAIEHLLGEQARRRLATLLDVQGDLVRFGLSNGFTDNQVRDAVEDLFRTFVSEWVLFILIGADDLATAITNDTGLAWLNMDANGATIRARLVARLP